MTETTARAKVGPNGGDKSAVGANGDEKAMVVVDIGKRKRKQVRELKNGGGPLVGRIEEAIAEMKASGTLDASAQTVVVIVEKKRRPVGWL